MQCSAREQGQDDDIVREPRIGSWSGEQGVKKKWNAFLETEKSVANRQTMPRVAGCAERCTSGSGRGGEKRTGLETSRNVSW